MIVSNRCPVTVKMGAGELVVERSAGGVATGLAGLHGRSQGLWIGWAGEPADLDPAARTALQARLGALQIVPVPLTADDVTRYYEGFCNGVLWPLFHYLPDQLPLHLADFEAYEQVNRRFAEVIAAHYRPGDLVWIHDYHLMRVPHLVRQRVPDARIGFFLHIPFPSSELFRIVPHREELLEGLLGADLIGFHTAGYARHFASAVLHVLGLTTHVDRMTWGERTVRLGVFPMGVDAATYGALGEDPGVLDQAAALRADGSQELLVGIDRLDYTKGLPRRLLAFERLIERHPELRGRVRLVQVSVPSRTGVDAYQELKEQVDTLIGRIHGAFATPTWTPIHYLFRHLTTREITALYRAAHVMLVTPVRDGMNLVAKEFVAARTDEDGVLVLSEFAGAAQELAEALRVNPYDIDRMADTYYRALRMPREDRRTRMRALRRRVVTYDAHRWARDFLDLLAATAPTARQRSGRDPRPVRGLVERLRRAPWLVLLLDYDGTLVPFAETPELAAPDPELLDLLDALAHRPATEVHVVSGRSRSAMEAWLGALPIGLHAEHGFWSRHPSSAAWHGRDRPELAWRPAVLAILEDFAARTPGSVVEPKTAGLAWHYRAAEPEFGTAQANELRLHLNALLSNEPVEVLAGSRVIEVRPQGVHKGGIVPPIARGAPSGALLVAIGDDRTDEDLFAALPESGVAVHVGPGPSRAVYRLEGSGEARELLRALLPGSPDRATAGSVARRA